MTGFRRRIRSALRLLRVDSNRSPRRQRDVRQADGQWGRATFDAVRGRADVPWRTDELMKLLRAED